MKKLFTKLSLLLGVFTLLGGGEAKAVENPTSATGPFTVYYDPAPFNEAGKKVGSKILELKDEDGYRPEIYQVKNYQGSSNITIASQETTYNEEIGLFEITFTTSSTNTTINPSDVRTLPYLINFACKFGYSALQQAQNYLIYNQGSWGTSTNISSTCVSFVNGGIYSYNTMAVTNVQASTATPDNWSRGIETDLEWFGSTNTLISDGSYTVGAEDELNLVSSASPYAWTVYIRNGSANRSLYRYYSKYTYNPTFTVKDSEGNVLSEGTDYVVTYPENNGDFQPTPSQTSSSGASYNDGFYIDCKVSISFLKKGTFTVEASMPEGNMLTGTSQEITVYVVDTIIQAADDQIVLWSQEDGTFSITKTLPEGYDVDDFEITLTPAFEEVTSGLTGWQLAWMNGMIAAGLKVDGYYSADEYNYSVNENSELQVEGHFPVSGTYQVNIEYTGEDDVTLAGFPVTITLNPNILMQYPQYNYNGAVIPAGDVININDNRYSEATQSITIAVNDAGNPLQLNKATGEVEEGSWDAATLFTPGNFLDTIEYYVATDKTDSPEYVTITDEDNYQIDLSALAEATTAYLYVKFTKNDVSSTETITLSKVTSNVPTGVGSIETAEEEAAEYYNLQGVKVANPEHGIFVKVQNGKATKVIL